MALTWYLDSNLQFIVFKYFQHLFKKLYIKIAYWGQRVIGISGSLIW